MKYDNLDDLWQQRLDSISGVDQVPEEYEYAYESPSEAWDVISNGLTYFEHSSNERAEQDRRSYPVPDEWIGHMISFDVEHYEARDAMYVNESGDIDQEMKDVSEACFRAACAHDMWLRPKPVQDAINDLIKIMIETNMTEERGMLRGQVFSFSYDVDTVQDRADRELLLKEWREQHMHVVEIVDQIYPELKTDYRWKAVCPSLLDDGMFGDCNCWECMPF